MSESTPLMKQYFEIKSTCKDAILFFRMGDFYEMFGEDAVTASAILQITLTSRDKNKANPVPMCGIPYHAYENYLAKLIQAGKKVAICEQVEDPKQAKGLVKREVIRVVTPGTHMPENMPSDKANRYVLSLYPREKITGVAFADLTTGEFGLYETTGSWEDEISRLEPSEIIIPESAASNDALVNGALSGFAVSFLEDQQYDYPSAYRVLTEHFRVDSLAGFGCEGMLIAVSAAGSLLAYLIETQKSELEHIRAIKPVERNRHMALDSATQRNLELIKNLNDGSSSSKATLFGVMDRTLTAMGGRLLKKWILQPLLDADEINARLDSVGYLKDDPESLDELRDDGLKGIPDLERLVSRITLGLGNARDLVAVKEGLALIPVVKDLVSGALDKNLSDISKRMDDLEDIRELIENTIKDSPPVSIREGGIIRDGYSSDLDELRNLSSNGKDYLAALEARERESTGISTMKIGYNRVFGYFIEVPRAKQNMVPEHYIRKQTLVAAERYITEELKTYENKILGAEEKIKTLEYGIFTDIRDTVAMAGSRIQSTASAVAGIDALASFAHIARGRRYTRPVVNSDERIYIDSGRHPVIEVINTSENFTPNDTELDGSENRLLIITGPNMAGKSTYMRQVALVTLMAQTGSFVPADEAVIGVVDRIFTRIGASDMLVKGQSTFMVEMTETANILNNATNRSLIILDEVGRGTSTFDGISIAWAVAESICQKLKARTLFATHYHELTEMAMVLEGVKNYNIVVKEWGDEIIFLRKIREGPADKSYGIQVGRLAGLPDEVIGRAKEILDNLEKAELNEEGRPKLAHKADAVPQINQQLDLFSSIPDPVLVELLDLDLARLTPIEALNKLYELQNCAKGK